MKTKMCGTTLRKSASKTSVRDASTSRPADIAFRSPINPWHIGSISVQAQDISANCFVFGNPAKAHQVGWNNLSIFHALRVTVIVLISTSSPMRTRTSPFEHTVLSKFLGPIIDSALTCLNSEVVFKTLTHCAMYRSLQKTNFLFKSSMSFQDVRSMNLVEWKSTDESGFANEGLFYHCTASCLVLSLIIVFKYEVYLPSSCSMISSYVDGSRPNFLIISTTSSHRTSGCSNAAKWPP